MLGRGSWDGSRASQRPNSPSWETNLADPEQRIPYAWAYKSHDSQKVARSNSTTPVLDPKLHPTSHVSSSNVSYQVEQPDPQHEAKLPTDTCTLLNKQTRSDNETQPAPESFDKWQEILATGVKPKPSTMTLTSGISESDNESELFYDTVPEPISRLSQNGAGINHKRSRSMNCHKIVGSNSTTPAHNCMTINNRNTESTRPLSNIYTAYHNNNNINSRTSAVSHSTAYLPLSESHTQHSPSSASTYILSRLTELTIDNLRNNARNREPPTTQRSLIAANIETLRIVPVLLAALPHCTLPSRLYTSLPAQREPTEPFTGNRCFVRVVNFDAIETALYLSGHERCTTTTLSSPEASESPVLVLNLANPAEPGGGWMQGHMAQEESLFYRSSLFRALETNFYPLPSLGAVYSPRVVVFRRSITPQRMIDLLVQNGVDPEASSSPSSSYMGSVQTGSSKMAYHEPHSLMDIEHPEELPIISVLSVAAIQDPKWVVSQFTVFLFPPSLFLCFVFFFLSQNFI
jgi:hypothetical protein